MMMDSNLGNHDSVSLTPSQLEYVECMASRLTDVAIKRVWHTLTSTDDFVGFFCREQEPFRRALKKRLRKHYRSEITGMIVRAQSAGNVTMNGVVPPPELDPDARQFN